MCNTIITSMFFKVIILPHALLKVSRIARCHGGVSGGASAGKSGYDLTFAIAYLRDFALTFDVLGESFETFVSWTALEGLCDRVGAGSSYSIGGSVVLREQSALRQDGCYEQYSIAGSVVLRGQSALRQDGCYE